MLFRARPVRQFSALTPFARLLAATAQNLKRLVRFLAQGQVVPALSIRRWLRYPRDLSATAGRIDRILHPDDDRNCFGFGTSANVIDCGWLTGHSELTFAERSTCRCSMGYSLRSAPTNEKAITHSCEDRLCQACRVPF